jgi:hypothetical protein
VETNTQCSNERLQIYGKSRYAGNPVQSNGLHQQISLATSMVEIDWRRRFDDVDEKPQPILLRQNISHH